MKHQADERSDGVCDYIDISEAADRRYKLGNLNSYSGQNADERPEEVGAFFLKKR